MVSIKHALQNNNYVASTFLASADRRKKKGRAEDWKIITVCLPYVKDLPEKDSNVRQSTHQDNINKLLDPTKKSLPWQT